MFPVILGTDINAYGVARSFHEAYGVKSLCIGRKALRYTRSSKILEVMVISNFDEDTVFLKTLKEIGEKYKEQKLLLISCGDGYTSLMAKYENELKDLFSFNIVTNQQQQELENKIDFYKICEQYGLDYPETLLISKEMVEKKVSLPFEYPVALKPNDSISYLDLNFPGKKKAYKIETEEELNKVLQDIYKSGYKDYMIAQDFIPGDSDTMAVLNAYVNRKGKVKMMCLGQCLLDAVLPAEIGNYNALVTVDGEKIYPQYQKFLEDYGYRGFANFDLKYDIRDGKYKVFEINIRQGRSSYYMTAGGCNFTKFLVDDLVEKKDEPVYYHKKRGLWLYVDPYVLKKYVPRSIFPMAKAELKRGFAFTQWYEKDRNFTRFLDYIRRRLSSIKIYHYYGKKSSGSVGGEMIGRTGEKR
ncbi:MAG: carboxylate--amine ligase [Tissierellia bacterium]|nr:carboxylate--amine ligase [Tissierellia bacterium]